jgi:hypothetical protein
MSEVGRMLYDAFDRCSDTAEYMGGYEEGDGTVLDGRFDFDAIAAAFLLATATSLPPRNHKETGDG